MEGITFIEDYIENPIPLFNDLRENVVWDERMSARKTASYGKAYNYSQIRYPYQEIPSAIEAIMQKIEKTMHFKPNNCLINFYENGQSKMGFHSDQTDILVENTGIVIISLGATRILRFRNIQNRNMIHDMELTSGSFFYMTQGVQDEWEHSIPKSSTQTGRMSLTFRNII